MSKYDRAQFKVASGQASQKDMAELGPERVREIKSSPSLIQVRCKSAPVKDLGDRVLQHAISGDSPDRMEDRIHQAGWKLKNYSNNPTVLWSHDGENYLPVGRGIELFTREVDGEVQLVENIEYAPKAMNEWAESVYQMTKGGFLPASSVGFLPIKVRQYDSDEERKADGLGDYGVYFEEQELLENSRVSVPAHPNAVGAGLKSLVAGGVLDADQAERFRASTTPTERDWLKRWERLFDVHWFHAAPCKLADAAPEAANQRPVRSMDDLGELLEECRAIRAEMEGARRELANLRFLSAPEVVRADEDQARESVAALLRGGGDQFARAFTGGKP